MAQYSVTEPRPITEITKDEYIAYEWIEVTSLTDLFRMFVRGRERTPEEALQASKEWDAFDNQASLNIS
jgi:hypothetical protein